MAKTSTPKPRFKDGTRVQLRRPPMTLGAGISYRPDTGTVRATEAPGDPFEVTIVLFDGETQPDMVWALDLESVPEDDEETPPTLIPGLAEAMPALQKIDKAVPIEVAE